MPENSRTDSQLTPAQLTASLAALVNGPYADTSTAHRATKQAPGRSRDPSAPARLPQSIRGVPRKPGNASLPCWAT